MMKKLKGMFKKEVKVAPRSMQDIVNHARELTLALGNENYIIDIKKRECERLIGELLKINNEAAERQRLDREAAELAQKAESKLEENKQEAKVAEGGN